MIVSMKIATPTEGLITLSHNANPRLFNMAKVGLGEGRDLFRILKIKVMSITATSMAIMTIKTLLEFIIARLTS